ncbi:phosphoenolpyruvate carboxylase [Terrihabitans sp. B22-R8]|uniref:phosphoenolpyruvate carboxylase n=1 Tax=Terrihabitans sp. B22-R8 TaxID=3425128 RepID=UPI00403D5168
MLDHADHAETTRSSVSDLLTLTENLRERADLDPFGNPVLAIALAISRRIEDGKLSEDEIGRVIGVLRDEAFRDRAQRLAHYVGGTNADASRQSYEKLAGRLTGKDAKPGGLTRNRAQFERTRFAAVFTAHPTFSAPAPVLKALAEQACGHEDVSHFASHRPQVPTLEDEFNQAITAITNGRDAIDQLNLALLAAARRIWPEEWTSIVPRAVILASWVGYDTDGRVDINWWDTLRLRLRMKHLQLTRLENTLRAFPTAGKLVERLELALRRVESQIDAAPDRADPDVVADFAAELIDGRDEALVGTEPLMDLFEQAIAEADPDDQLGLSVARAGLASHGMSLANTHVRLNAAQIHNAARLRLGLEDPPADPFRRRVLLAAVNSALDRVRPVPVDFGAILAEQASATKLMMTVAQIAKHIDGEAPIRFLIAETESGYTLLSALWLAKLFGVEKHIEISPLFETAEALEQGSRAIEEALRSPHYRAYLRETKKLSIQFGYSDSGRYIGQLAATFLIERLRLKLAELLTKYDLPDVELILFDTHGDSIGRGSHPGSLADRLKYLSPSASRATFARTGIFQRNESSFQGGDGYLLFGTPELAMASIARIAEHAFDVLPTGDDPIYQEADFAADFFATIGAAMHELVEDPGYAALLGAFGPALLDPTGSRPAVRQNDGLTGPTVIKHPRELRAILNNAILQQLGWCANTLQGVGAAAARQPELFLELSTRSPRFRRSLDFVRHALLHSDLDVLRATIALLDPGPWLDRAAHLHDPGDAKDLVSVARALDRLDVSARVQAMFRRIQTDFVQLRAVWPDAPRMKDREMLLHALRIALIQRIWLTATAIPDFSPRHGLTRDALQLRLLQLEVPPALTALSEIFPNQADPTAGRDFGEPHGPRAAASYAKEHQAIFEPIGRSFAMVREIGAAITHEVGAFG